MRLVVIVLLILVIPLLLLGCAPQYVYVPVTAAPQADVVYDRPVYQTPVGVTTTVVAVPQTRIMYPAQVYPYWGWRPYRPYAWGRWEACC
jgi:hypothetical protein